MLAEVLLYAPQNQPLRAASASAASFALTSSSDGPAGAAAGGASSRGFFASGSSPPPSWGRLGGAGDESAPKDPGPAEASMDRDVSREIGRAGSRGARTGRGLERHVVIRRSPDGTSGEL